MNEGDSHTCVGLLGLCWQKLQGVFVYEIVSRPSMNDPVLVMHLRGWIDAGSSADLAMDSLTGQLGGVLVATFDDDDLIDYRSRRPTMHLDDGLLTKLSWPNVELKHATDPLGNDLLFLTGTEPDRHWKGFASAIVDLCHSFGVTRIVGLGAFPAPAPHTRPTKVVCTASSRHLADRIGHNSVKMEVPAGVHAAVEAAAAADDVEAATIWAPIPHYASTMDYPAGAVALIEALVRLTNINVDVQPLRDAAQATLDRLNELVQANPQHVKMLQALEQHVDDLAATRDTPVPTGDELAAQFQQFLDELG